MYFRCPSQGNAVLLVIRCEGNAGVPAKKRKGNVCQICTRYAEFVKDTIGKQEFEESVLGATIVNEESRASKLPERKKTERLVYDDQRGDINTFLRRRTRDGDSD